MALHLKSTGIDFGDFANNGAMTSELLNDYEEGTWTPSTTLGSAGSPSGTYTHTGRVIICNGEFIFPSQTSGNHATIAGLPYTALNHTAAFNGSIRYTDYAAKQIMLHGNSNNVTVGLYEVDYGATTTTVTWSEVSGNRLDFNLIYFS